MLYLSKTGRSTSLLLYCRGDYDNAVTKHISQLWVPCIDGSWIHQSSWVEACWPAYRGGAFRKEPHSDWKSISPARWIDSFIADSIDV
jgi:hypothetical protein